jgi:hypothetical protein
LLIIIPWSDHWSICEKIFFAANTDVWAKLLSTFHQLQTD